MTIHEKINLRSYHTVYLSGGRFRLPYMFPSYIYSIPRFYFNSSKSLIFNFKR